MNVHQPALKTVTPDQLDRRTALKGVTLGAGAVVLRPFLNALAAEDKVPAGLRVQPQGNSWSFNVTRLRATEAAAGIKGSEYYAPSEVIEGKPRPVYLPGCLNGTRKGSGEGATLKARLEAGKIDVFSYTHSGWHETDIAGEVAEFGFTHNKSFRVLWQAGWMVHDGLGVGKNGPARDAVKIADLRAALDKARKPVEEKIEAINKKLGQRVVCIVPVGDAFVRMRQMIVDGKFPGVTKQSELFNDDMPHQGRLGSLLQDYCVFAALYHKSPVGLELKLDKEITPEQNAILQKIAWETVFEYPLAGFPKELGKEK